jgi:hypothetical protein
VRRILSLTSLAPDIVEDILGGSEPSGVSLERLMKGFPLVWEEQRKVLGFPERCITREDQQRPSSMAF